MDQSVGATQKIVVTLAILIALLLLFFIGYSLWKKAQDAAAQLAQKEALDAVIRQQENDANISITNEASNPSNFSFESLTQNPNNLLNSTSSEFAVLATSTEEEVEIVATPTKPVVKKPVAKKTYYNYDRPLTAEEIRRIRMLPLDSSVTGSLQNQLEVETQGVYKAQYK